MSIFELNKWDSFCPKWVVLIMHVFHGFHSFLTDRLLRDQLFPFCRRKSNELMSDAWRILAFIIRSSKSTPFCCIDSVSTPKVMLCPWISLEMAGRVAKTIRRNAQFVQLAVVFSLKRKSRKRTLRIQGIYNTFIILQYWLKQPSFTAFQSKWMIGNRCQMNLTRIYVSSTAKFYHFRLNDFLRLFTINWMHCRISEREQSIRNLLFGRKLETKLPSLLRQNKEEMALLYFDPLFRMSNAHLLIYNCDVNFSSNFVLTIRFWIDFDLLENQDCTHEAVGRE